MKLYRLSGLILLGVMAVVISACQDDTRVPTQASDCGLFAPADTVYYAYVARDSAANIVAEGMLSLFFDPFPNPSEDPVVSGIWAIERVQSGAEIGPQVGSGEIVGTMLAVDRIEMDLNPGQADNNVVLFGDPDPCPNMGFAGDWMFIAVAGVRNAGFFTATRIEAESMGTSGN